MEVIGVTVHTKMPTKDVLATYNVETVEDAIYMLARNAYEAKLNGAVMEGAALRDSRITDLLMEKMIPGTVFFI